MRRSSARAYGIALSLLPPASIAWIKSALAIAQLLPGIPLRPLELLTPRPTRRSITFPIDGNLQQEIGAELFVPGGPPRPNPGVVLSLGAADLGGNDPRAVMLAEMLSRSGFMTMVVNGAPGLTDRDSNSRLDLDEAPDVLAAAFAYLSARPDVDERRVGLMGVCIGGGACLLTAARPELADRVGFVFLIGPYLSLRRVLQAMSSRTAASIDGRIRVWTASEWALERQRDWLLRTLSPDERATVQSALTDGRHPMPDGWTPRAEAVFELLKGVSSEHADRFIDALGASFVGALEAASPSRQLESLRAETLIMHSVGDALIPVEESRRLAQALQGRVPLHYAEFTLFDHVDVSRALPAATLLREVLRLINHTRMLMRFAI